ncbi:glycerophosphodiester phosphodiesterase family protein [Qingshengfaniella alkalisoli]|nr:glycerophosphodiester phosphodiesterase family protein [Qingshengfaniella alkalisoli]
MIIKDYLTHIWKARWPLLATHALLTGVTVALISPLLGLTIRIAVERSGQPVLADQDIAMFLLTPVGFIGAVVVGSIMLALAVLEVSVMMSVLHARARGATDWGHDALAAVGMCLPRIALFAGHLILRLLIIALPFVALVGLIAWLRLTEYDINYYLATRPPEFIQTLRIGIPILLLGGLVILARLVTWSMALPILLFTQCRPKDAFGESRKLTKGRRPQLLAAMLMWALFAAALVMLVAGLTAGLTDIAELIAGTSLVRLVGGLSVVLLIWALLTLATSTLTQSGFALLLLDWMEQLGGDVHPYDFEHPAPLKPSRMAQIVVILGFMVVAAIFAGVRLGQTLRTSDTVEIIAHRGAAAVAPENTLSAIEAALDAGADWVEIDVQETAEGEVIVIHDSDFMRIGGSALKVWDSTRTDLDEIEIGSWFGPDFEGEPVPLLSEVLDMSKGRAKVLIELKFYDHDDRLAQRVSDIVAETGMDDQVAAMSLDMGQVEHMKAIRPEWDVGLLAATAVGDLTRLEVDFLAVNSGIATPALLRHARSREMPVMVWTVDDPVDMSRMISRGVNGLITNDPATARQVLGARAGMTTVERLLLEAAELLGADLDLTDGPLADERA